MGASIPALKSSTGAPLPSLKVGKADVFGTALIWSEGSAAITIGGIVITQVTKPKVPTSNLNTVTSSPGLNYISGNIRPSIRVAYVCI